MKPIFIFFKIIEVQKPLGKKSQTKVSQLDPDNNISS